MQAQFLNGANKMVVFLFLFFLLEHTLLEASVKISNSVSKIACSYNTIT